MPISPCHYKTSQLLLQQSFVFTDYEKNSGEVIIYHFHDGLMAFCNFARLSRKPKETLEGHYEKERRRDDAENGVFERGRKV